MNREQIVAAFRAAARDSLKPPLWSNDEVQDFLDDAHAEAAERALLLTDSSTPEICEIAIAANEAAYTLDSRIIEVKRAKLDSGTKPLVLKTSEALDIDWPGWDSEDADEPCIAAIDAEGAGWKLTLVPAPAAATVMRLTVYRRPLCSLVKDDAEPEINPRLHIRLIEWMLYRAYSQDDADTFDADKADKHAGLFAATFGPKRDAMATRFDHDQQFPVVRGMGL